MTDSQIINPGIPVAGPYSPGIKVGNLLFISGQGPTEGALDIESQTTSTMEKIKKILETAGGNMSNIVRTTVYLKDISQFRDMNQKYKAFFEQNGVTEKFPTRVTVEVSNLPLETMLIEISAIAIL
jgi:2-iminobutanoate/2-iminopropanoate deaminase